MAAIPVRTRWQATTLIAATLLGASAAPATEVFRWTDATGKVHFGDHPPEQGAAAMTIHSSAGGTDSGRRQQRTQRILDDFAHQRAEQAAMAQASAEKEATRDAVQVVIDNFLWADQTGLPSPAYSEEDVKTKSRDVYRHVHRVYPSVPSPFYSLH